MRALMVVNPKATTTTARTREVIVRALASDLKLDVATTDRRGHAAELAREARVDGLDLVIGVGGDGTVNELVNGLLGRRGPDEEMPALAIVPGGSTNVFARALGMPENPVEATGQLLDALHEGRIRSIGLGRADARWFTFTAGIGLDAAVVARVERARARGRTSTNALYLRSALRQFYGTGERRHGPISLERPGEEPVEGLVLGIVANTAPWTYLGDWPVNPAPKASFDTGLDLFGLQRLRTVTALRHIRQMFAASGRPPTGRYAVSLHDLDEFTLRSTHPVAFQMDGEYLGEREKVRFVAVRDALRVIA
jgi:diacylglycerol kinase family enzyme